MNLSKITKINSLSFVFVLAVLLVGSAFSTNNLGDRNKQFVVARAGSLKMSPKVEAKLEKAFKAVYGKKIGYEMLKLVKMDKRIWLAVYGSRGTIGIPLRRYEGQSVIDFGGSIGAVICATTSSCSCCKVDCSCSKANGGQDDCGSSACKPDTPADDDISEIASMLLG